MANKKVVFEIEVDADSNIEAAKTVQEWLADGSKYQFYVQDAETLKVVSIDLDAHETNMEVPVHKYHPMIEVVVTGEIKLLKKYDKSTVAGVQIKHLETFSDGKVNIVDVDNGVMEFYVSSEMSEHDADYIICDLQQESAINVSKY